MQRPISSPHSKFRDPPTPPFDYSMLKMCLGKIFGVESSYDVVGCAWSGKGEVGGNEVVVLLPCRRTTHTR
jgi:hypothetical protein